nr:hypothetical protein [Tanacetum cinerariifolium]
MIIETIHVDFDELIAMASEQFCSRPRPKLLTLGTIGLGLMLNIPSSTPYVPPTKNDWEILFQLMFDEYLNPPSCQPGTYNSPAVPERTILETFSNISPEDKAHYDAEAELMICGYPLKGYNRVSLLTSRMSRLVFFGNFAYLLQEMENQLSHTTPECQRACDMSLHPSHRGGGGWEMETMVCGRGVDED